MLRVVSCSLVGGMVLALAACGGGGGSDPKGPFERFAENTVFDYSGPAPFSTTGHSKFGIIGQKEIGERTYQRYKIGRDATTTAELFDPGTPGPEGWFSETSPGTFEFAGLSTTLDDTQAMLDPPVVIDDDWPEGESRTVSVQANATSTSNPELHTVVVNATGAFVETEASVTTAQGTYHGCRHYQGTFSVDQGEITGLPSATPHDIEVWYHPKLGIVAAKVPVAGVDIGLSGEEDYGSATSGTNTIRKVGFTGPSTPTFRLSTYDRAGAYDADKDTHAKMLLELRWADDEIARTQDMPHELMYRVVFGTFGGMFYFPHQLIESPVSLFHPEENGQGYRYWYAFVDEAAKNQEENGISYDILIDADPSLPAVRVSARIQYQLLGS